MIKRFFRLRFLIGFAVVIGFGYLLSGLPTHFGLHSPALLRWVEDIPTWMRSPTCVAPNDTDHHEDELALEVFKAFGNGNGDGMRMAAFGYFGTTKRRKEGNGYVTVCSDVAIRDEFVRLTVKTPYWRVGGFPGNHDILHLRVARNVGPRSSEIIAFVAETAFAENPINDNSGLLRDIRPLARVILAEFGAAAVPWSEQAFAAMSASNELGTTAAQIAVVTHRPGAMERTAILLDGILRDYPHDPIPDHVWIRFYELAFALAAAGEDAKPFIDPVVRMTCRTIEVWSPPFGWLSLPPDEMSTVLKIVGVDPCRAPPLATGSRPLSN